MLLPVADALARILRLVEPIGTEEIPLAEAAGRVLAADAIATRNQPPFAASAMDGYAVRAAEAMVGARLEVTGEAAAGSGHGGKLGPGQAIRIFTGAPVPDAADAILIQENARRTGDAADTIEVVEAPTAWAYIRPAGMDFAADFRLTAPRRLTGNETALLAAMNVPRLTVRRRPVVALIPTGDELVAPGQTPGPDQIVSSNDIGLAALLAAAMMGSRASIQRDQETPISIASTQRWAFTQTPPRDRNLTYWLYARGTRGINRFYFWMNATLVRTGEGHHEPTRLQGRGRILYRRLRERDPDDD